MLKLIIYLLVTAILILSLDSVAKAEEPLTPTAQLAECILNYETLNDDNQQTEAFARETYNQGMALYQEYSKNIDEYNALLQSYQEHMKSFHPELAK